MKTTKRNFKINYGTACASDSIRPLLSHVHFRDGYIMATNAHLLIKCPLELHDIPNPQMLEGKFIHKDTFAKIVKYHTAIPQEDGIMCYDKSGRKVALYLYAEIERKYPDFEAVLNSAYSAPFAKDGALAFKLSLLSMVEKVLINPQGTLKIESKNALQTIIKPLDKTYSEQVCLIMGIHDSSL